MTTKADDRMAFLDAADAKLDALHAKRDERAERLGLSPAPAAGEPVAWSPLPYTTPSELWKAFKGGAKFVLHYHGKQYPVERMEPLEYFVYVQPPGIPVKVRADGSDAEGAGNTRIWLAAAPVAPPAVCFRIE
jgi:hypothetical protein